jgi:hypothetical protein
MSRWEIKRRVQREGAKTKDKIKVEENLQFREEGLVVNNN